MRMHRTIGIVVFLAVVFCVAIGMQAEPLPGISRALPPPPQGPFWRLLGNASTDPLIHFLGTTDDEPLLLKTVGFEAMRIDIAGNVGIGTPTPAAKLHIDEAVSTTNQEVARVTFSNDAPNLGVRGIRAVSTPLNVRGTQIGVEAQTSKTGGPDAQRGSAQGSLSHTSGFFLRGTFLGVQGTSRPNVLDNFNDTARSHGLGGFFKVQPDNTLTLDNTGTYWIGGAYGEVAGTIDNTPSLGAVAGIIGVDNAAGTADSYAGYFDGRLRVTDLPQPQDNALTDIVVADVQGVLHTKEASEPWQNAVLLSGFTNAGGVYAPAQFYKDITGAVHLRGVVIAPAGGTTINIFQVPKEYRPEFLTTVLFPHSTGIVITPNTFKVGSIHNGNVRVLANGGAGTVLFLGGISWPTQP